MKRDGKKDKNMHTHSQFQVHPTHPYSRIQLTVEPDSFVLQPYVDPTPGPSIPDSDSATQPQPQPQPQSQYKDLVQILFSLPAESADKEENQDVVVEAIAKDTASDENSGRTTNGEESLSKLTKMHGRVSSLSPGSYTRSESAKDYLIYGCVGLLDLYSGPYFIVITSIRSLGNIEDKPIYGINKVAVLPMDAVEAQQVLDKLAQWVDPSAGPVVHIQQASEQPVAPSEPVKPHNEKGTSGATADPTKSPKIRFSLMDQRQDKGHYMSPSNLNLPSAAKLDEGRGDTVPVSPPASKRVSFEVPRLSSSSRSNLDLSVSDPLNNGQRDVGVSTPSSPLAIETRPSQVGFFARFKENVLDKKSRKSLDIPAPSASAAEITASSAAILDDTNLASIPNIGTSVPTTLWNSAMNPTKEDSPDLLPKSPTALETAEKFVTESTKQIADWSEEAVSGILRATPSFSLSKPVLSAGSEPEHAVEHAHIASNESVEETKATEEQEERHRILDRRIIREISSIFGTGFYFSTTFNLLSSMQKRFDQKKDSLKSSAPLWQRVDRRFWWNENLLEQFLEIKADGYILPIMQGYVEIEQCKIEEQPFEFTLISRRSRERSGLRYQRRGIDEDGNTANFVETEQILRIVRGDSDHQVSFVQTRGSIPLFWSQSPYRLKPIPIMERSERDNEIGFKKHVDSQMNQYGRQIFINLVEQHGRELVAGSAYTRYVEALAEPQIRYVEFDFHEQCRGMKYENIERLVKSLEAPIHELGYCWLAPRNEGIHCDEKGSFERLFDQKGVIRTNCMDCLDRTNVVQSAIGRHILNHQLLRLGIASFPDKGLSVYEDFENVFNNVWANNGDAISREYAGTSALKGDFTRTGKRNLQGMINDATNSMARMYQNTFKDYFRQATIDYLLGTADVDVFKNLQTTPFGTVVVPPPILPPTAAAVAPSQDTLVSASTPELPVLDFPLTVAAQSTESSALLPSLIPRISASTGSLQSAATKDLIVLPTQPDEKALQQDAWVKIREAAIETSAEIVISPGEERWKGWTFICCSNEISSALTSASSPQSTPQQSVSSTSSSSFSNKKSPKKNNTNSPFNLKSDAASSSDKAQAVFYDEKIVLLTERALYICTYDYEMEKVFEFWRLALEKITGIDKGAFFLTAQDVSKQGQDPLENYGFAVVYRANAGGETMRINSGSVRNRRLMGIDRLPPSDPNLDCVAEEEECGANMESSPEVMPNDRRSASSLLKDEPKKIRSVRFKIVKHPETSIVPFVASSTLDSTGPSKANPAGYRRTAQDCAEWVVTEIVQARCELISVAEGAAAALETAEGSGHLHPQSARHNRSPSEEYNYHPLQLPDRRSSVQVDLLIRDRVLQSLDQAGQLEKDVMKKAQAKSKLSKKPFAGLFSSTSKAAKSSEQQPHQRQLPAIAQSQQPSTASGATNKSWRKRWQFGQDTDDETDEEEGAPLTEEAASSRHLKTPLPKGHLTVQAAEVQASNNASRSSSQSVFAKLKQAVKNL